METTETISKRYADLMTIPQAARTLRLSEKYVRELALKRNIAVRYPGQKVLRVELTALQEVLLASKAPSNVDPRVKC